MKRSCGDDARGRRRQRGARAAATRGGWMDGSSNEDAACFETYFRDDGVEFVDDV